MLKERQKRILRRAVAGLAFAISILVIFYPNYTLNSLQALFQEVDLENLLERLKPGSPIVQQPLEENATGVKVVFWRAIGSTVNDFYEPDWEFLGVSCPDSGLRFIDVTPSTSSLKTLEGRRKALSTADIVVFNFDFPRHYVVPRRRAKDSVYVLASLECPAWGQRRRVRVHPFLDRFNFFWSYNRDLLLRTTYSTRTEFRLEDISSAPIVPFREKSNAPVLVLVSKCAGTTNGRSSLIQRLMGNLPVHSYGRCYHNKKFPKLNQLRNISGRSSVSGKGLNEADLLSAMYKFLLSIENSLCEDYVTEKLFRGLRVGSIPIVASINGIPNYSAFLPHTQLPIAVNTADFDTVPQLAARLQQIANNQKLYSEYMRYRTLPRDQLNPAFVEMMDGTKVENRAWCRFARRFVSKGGGLNLTAARLQKADVKESCSFTKILI